MELNEIDDILNSLGMGAPITSNPSREYPITPEEASENTLSETSSSFSEDDINNILANNGYEESVNDEDDYEGDDYEEEEEEYEPDEYSITDDNIDYSNRSQEIAQSIQEEILNEALNVGTSRRFTREQVLAPEGILAQIHQIDADDEILENPIEENPSTNNIVLPATQDISQNIIEEGSLCITPNSPTLLIDESTTRFSGAEWFNEIQKASVIIAGIGGIGSNVAFQLARMAPECMVLYDSDNVERVNMAGQLYSHNDIGKSKVSAITDMISLYTTAQQVYAVKEKFTEFTETGDIMICGFDNMKARKTFFTSWKRHLENKSEEDKLRCLYLDGRLSMDTLQIFCIQGNDKYNIERYQEEFLFRDSQAEHTVCSMKQTTYLACMIGSLMVNMFTNFIANLLDPIIPYDLPFFTEYDAQNVIFKTEK